MLILSYIWASIKRWYHSTFSFDEMAEQMCPNCGLVGQKPMEWVAEYRCNMLHCPRCKAAWGKDPILPIGKWFVTNIEEVMLERAAAEDQRIADKEREAGIKR